MIKREQKTVKLSEIKPNPDNPRVIKRNQLKSLQKSLNDFPEMMELRPIVVDEDGVILGGNMRYQALLANGATETEVETVSGLTPEQKREFVIKDNVAFGDWDWDKLANEWDTEKLDEWGLDIPETEATGQEIEEVDVPEVAGEPDSQAGEVYSLGRHRLVCGDCTNADIMSKLMGDKAADLLLTDPPYGVDLWNLTPEEAKKQHHRTDGLTVKNDNIDRDEMADWLLEVFRQIGTYLKAGGAYYIWHDGSTANEFYNAIANAIAEPRQQLIWVKNRIVMGRQDYQWRHEPCLYGWKDGAAHYWCGSRSQDTILDKEIDYDAMTKADAVAMLKEILDNNALPTTALKFPRPSASREHPTMKPIALLAYLIKNSSRSGEIVLDPFGGSGSTLLACEQTGRVCYTVELDRHYCDVIRKRYWQFVNNGDEDGWQVGTK